jgi:hypothetical protein
MTIYLFQSEHEVENIPLLLSLEHFRFEPRGRPRCKSIHHQLGSYQ